MILDDTGKTIDELFEWFDPQPIGAGRSILPAPPHVVLTVFQHLWRKFIAHGYERTGGKLL